MSAHDGKVDYKHQPEQDVKSFVIDMGFDGSAFELCYIPGGKGVKASIKFDANNVYTCEGGPGDVSIFENHGASSFQVMSEGG